MCLLVATYVQGGLSVTARENSSKTRRSGKQSDLA